MRRRRGADTGRSCTPATTPAAAPAEASQPTEQAKPKKDHKTTEAQLIYELHRHGI